MSNEPVAMRYDFDGYGYKYIDSGSGSDWQTRVDGELLYTHPADESFDRTASHMAGEYVSLYSHPSEHNLGVAEAIGFEKGYQAGLRKAQE